LNINILLQSNYSKKLLQRLHDIPVFYRTALCDWIKFTNTNIDRRNFVWYNRNINIENKSVFYKEFYNIGIHSIFDLYNDKGGLTPFKDLIARGLPKGNWLRWCGLVDSLKGYSGIQSKCPAKPNVCFMIGNKTLDDCKTKDIYAEVNDMIGRNTVHIPRIANYMSAGGVIDWEEIYMYPFKFLVDSRTKEFQYKFLHDIIVNRYWLEKWKIIDTNLCRLCKKEQENLCHMFWSCIFVQQFWKDFNTYMSVKLNMLVSKEEAFLGVANTVVNTILVNTKVFIYNSFLNDRIPKLNVFLHFLSRIINIEQDMYKRNGRLSEWEAKWQKFIEHEIW
jgi:hypothetical protein